MKWKQKTATIPIETAPNTVPTEEEECVEQERFEFWHRFCENKTAVFGLVVLVLIILMAVFANFITDPANVTFQDMNARSLSPSLEHPLDGTSSPGLSTAPVRRCSSPLPPLPSPAWQASSSV